MSDWAYDLLADPDTGAALERRGLRLLTPQGQPRAAAGRPVLKLLPDHVPHRHRVWRWVYDRVASRYDAGVRFAWKRAFGGAPIDRHSFLDAMVTEPGWTILETACGTAENMSKLPMGRRYVGLDISSGMLHQAHRKMARLGRAAQMVQGDAQKLPFRDGVFNLVFHMGGLQFMQAPVAAIAEMHRAAAPGAQVWVIDESASLAATLGKSALGAQDTGPLTRLALLAPREAQNVDTKNISGGELYCLSFTKAT